MQPAPVNRGVVVPDALIEVIRSHATLSDADKDDLVALIEQRDELGRSKYGQPLTSLDGRSGVQDALEELGDLLQYALKCKLNGSEDLEQLARMVSIANAVLGDILAGSE